MRDVLEKLKVGPGQIWNCDETNVQLEHKPTAVVGRKGSKHLGRVANSKESISILGCGNALDDIMSPMVIVKGKTKRSLMGWKTEDAPPQTKWTYQSRSFMDTTLGAEWFENVFLPECGQKRPQLLIVDSHCSHEPLELLQSAKNENITLFSFPSNCTHELQPWDFSMFSPFKKSYNEVCSEFMSENIDHTITKQTWPLLFCKAWTSAITKPNMVSGFYATDIYPFNPNAIQPTAFQQWNANQAPPAPLVADETEADVNVDQSSTPSSANITTVTAEIHATPSCMNLMILPHTLLNSLIWLKKEYKHLNCL